MAGGPGTQAEPQRLQLHHPNVRRGSQRGRHGPLRNPWKAPATTTAAIPLRLITIGVGIENFNDFLLEQLAQHGNGWYRYLSDVDQARATFSRENWLALSIPFADQTRAQVTWDPDVVESWRIVGYENRVTSDESFTQARKEFAEIPAGAATTVFYELELKDPRFSGPLTLGDVELRWVTPSTGESNRQHASVTGQDNSDFYNADPYCGWEQ